MPASPDRHSCSVQSMIKVRVESHRERKEKNNRLDEKVGIGMVHVRFDFSASQAGTDMAQWIETHPTTNEISELRDSGIHTSITSLQKTNGAESGVLTGKHLVGTTPTNQRELVMQRRV